MAVQAQGRPDSLMQHSTLYQRLWLGSTHEAFAATVCF